MEIQNVRKHKSNPKKTMSFLYIYTHTIKLTNYLQGTLLH